MFKGTKPRGREVMRGELLCRKKGKISYKWEKREVVAHCGQPDNPNVTAQLVLYEKPGQKLINSIKLEDAAISTNEASSSCDGARMSMSPDCSSGSGTFGSDYEFVQVEHTFMIVNKKGDCFEFRIETGLDERREWVKLLHFLILFPRESIPDEPMTNPIDMSLKQTLEAKEFRANSVWPVYMLPENVGRRANILGIKILALRNEADPEKSATLSLYQVSNSATPLVTWDRNKMRRTGKTGNLVYIEIGRRCQWGPGLVWMYAGFGDGQPLRETLHNFLFKGDGNVLPTGRGYNQVPSFHSEFASSTNSFGTSISRDESPAPVRLDMAMKWRNRELPRAQEMMRSSSGTPPSCGPSIDVNGTVVSGHPSEYNNTKSNNFESDYIIMKPAQPATKPISDDSDYIIMKPAQPATKPMSDDSGYNRKPSLVEFDPDIVVSPADQLTPEPDQAYNTLQHFPSRSNPQWFSGVYSSLPDIKERHALKPISTLNYTNHPLPNAVRSTSSQDYSPGYENVFISDMKRRVRISDYENTQSEKRAFLNQSNGAENPNTNYQQGSARHSSSSNSGSGPGFKILSVKSAASSSSVTGRRTTSSSSRGSKFQILDVESASHSGSFSLSPAKGRRTTSSSSGGSKFQILDVESASHSGSFPPASLAPAKEHYHEVAPTMNSDMPLCARQSTHYSKVRTATKITSVVKKGCFPKYSDLPKAIGHFIYTAKDEFNAEAPYVCPEVREDNLLGKGGFGTVISFVIEGKKYAVKLTEYRQIELNLLSKLDHPNIIKLLGVMKIDNPACVPHELKRKLRIPTRNPCYQFMPRVKGDLCTLVIRNFGPIRNHLDHPKSDVIIGNGKVILNHILCGLSYLHEEKIYHRDLKTSNILVECFCSCDDVLLCSCHGNGFNCMISDFDSAKEFSKEEPAQFSTHGQDIQPYSRGTHGYRPPELTHPKYRAEGKWNDLWSFGVITLEMVVNKKDLGDVDLLDIDNKETVHVQMLKIPLWKCAALDQRLKPFAELADKCLTLEWRDRPSVHQLRKDHVL